MIYFHLEGQLKLTNAKKFAAISLVWGRVDEQKFLLLNDIWEQSGLILFDFDLKPPVHISIHYRCPPLSCER